MIVDCPRCKKPFALSSRSFKPERFDITQYIICSSCGWMAEAHKFIPEDRMGELVAWANEFNASLKENKPVKNKGLWEVVIYDASLRKILVGEKKLKESDSDPSIHLLIRSIEQPDKGFCLKKFNEMCNKRYGMGYINPQIRITFLLLVPDITYFDL